MNATEQLQDSWSPPSSKPIDPTVLVAVYVLAAVPIALYNEFRIAYDAFYFGSTRIDQLVLYSALTVTGAWLCIRQIVQGGFIRRLVFLPPLFAHLYLIGFRFLVVYKYKAG